MAEEFNFDDIDLTEGSAPKPSPEDKELSLRDRLISTLIFDTQPKKRAAYLKRQGFELNPKDDNLFRVLGSKDDNWYKIDPGGVFDYSQYKKGGMSEFGKDALEGVLDFLQGGVTEAAGSGAALATAGGTMGAGIPAAPVARVGGRIAMFNAIEGVKDKIGDLFLDEEIPTDYALRATQTAIQGVGPEAIQAAAKGSVKALSGAFSGVSKGVRNLLKIGDGKIGVQAWEALKRDPALIADENALRNASSTVDSAVERLLGGQNKQTADFSSSVFQEKMTPLETARKEAASELDQRISIEPARLKAFFQKAKIDLEQPLIKSQRRQDSIKYIDDLISQVDQIMPKGKPGEAARQAPRIPFSKVDEMVKELQSDLYSKKLLNSDWRDAIKKVVDGPQGLNSLLKQAADQAGSPYSKIKSQEAQLFQAYDNLVQNVDVNKARRFVIGDDFLDPKFTSTDPIAKNFRLAVEEADQVLGTKIGDSLKSGQIQGQFWKSIADSGPRGSGGFLTGAASTGLPTYGAMSIAGAPQPAAAGAAAVAATAGGLLSQPRIGVPVAIGAEQASQAISRGGQALSEAIPSSLSRAAQIGGTRGILGQMEGETREPISSPVTDEFNFDDIEDLTK